MNHILYEGTAEVKLTGEVVHVGSSLVEVLNNCFQASLMQLKLHILLGRSLLHV